MPENKNLLGDYTVFGFSRDGAGMKKRIWEQLGVEVQTISIGDVGQFFYYTTYGDVSESDDLVVFKLGFLRSKTKTALSAQQLVKQKLLKPGKIETDELNGNGLVIGISKREPVFTAFQTLMAVPQLYYSANNDEIICSDVLRCIVEIIPFRTLDESVIPQHFLFRSVYGASTYFHGVKRLLSGEYLRWMDGHMQIQLVRSLDTLNEEAVFIREDHRALKLLDETLESVVGDYVQQIESAGEGYGNLLSGGVDSTLIQHFLNVTSSRQRVRSISYAIQVPAFTFEVEYARQASQLLGTEHTFVDYFPQDYPALLERVVDILAQPPNLEIEPSFLAVIEYICVSNWQERFFFSANAADAVFGNPDSWKLKGLNLLQKIPGIVPFLRNAGNAISPLSQNRSHTLLKGAEILANKNDPDYYCSPSNTLAVTVQEEDWNILRRCFGDRLITETLASRRNLASYYSQSNHYLDKVHFIDQLTYTYEIAVQEQQLFLGNKLEQVHPFNDEDLLKAALTIHPDLRYVKDFRSKHLLKRLLEKKTKAPVAHLRKGGSAINEDLIAWMRSGSLRPLVEAIDLPGFMNRTDLEKLIREPDYFLWSLLTYDLFKKRIIEDQVIEKA